MNLEQKKLSFFQKTISINSRFVCHHSFVYKLMTILYLVLFLPKYAFQIENITYLFLEILFTAFFIFDILITFWITFINQSKNEIFSKKKIAIKYLTSYFIIDLITNYTTLRLVKLFINDKRIHVLLDCIRVLKLFSILKYPIDNHIRKNLKFIGFKVYQMYTLYINFKLFQVLQLILYTGILLHTAGCIFICIGKQSFEDHSWLTWINIQNEDNFNIYMNAIYYCFMTLTTVGYGDILAVTTIERIFAVMIMVLSIFFYS